MARSGKAIQVKIPTAKVIKALETKLAQLQADYTKQDENEAKYQKAMEKWRKEIGKWAVANFAKAENIRTNYRNWNKTLNVDFDLIVDEKDFPAEPTKDYEQIHQHTYREMKEVWDKPRPKDLGKPQKLSDSERRSAMRRAQKAGRPYPNLIDNMIAAKGSK